MSIWKFFLKHWQFALKAIFLLLFQRAKQLMQKEDLSLKAEHFFRYLTSNRLLEFERVSSNSGYSRKYSILLITFFNNCIKKKIGKTFIKWIQILLRDQEFCIINGGTTTKYFKLKKGTRQGYPISACLFILVFEIAFIFIKENKNIKGINIFDNIFLYSVMPMIQDFF